MSQARDFADSFSAVSTGRRNLIINGAMQVAQRGTSFTSVAAAYTLDRFRMDEYTDGAVDVSQSTDAPDEFSNSLKVDITTADTTISSTYYTIVSQRLEAQNLQHLQYGTSSAKTMTLSFWVKSNKTGTYVLEVDHVDAPNVYLSVTYTIDSADTWEKKTINIAGNTSNAINNDNGEGFRLHWWLSAGSNYNSGTHNSNTWHTTQADRAAGLNVNIMDSTSNEWYITGVQLELGNSASPFEHRSYGDELSLCQRYFFNLADSSSGGDIGTGTMFNSTVLMCDVKFPVTMRAAPTLDHATDTGGYRFWRNGTSDDFNGWTYWYDAHVNGGALQAESNLSGTAGQGGRVVVLNSGSGYVHFDAEL